MTPSWSTDAPRAVGRIIWDQEAAYERRGRKMSPRIDRVYDNARARLSLGWTPRYDVRHQLDSPVAGTDPRRARARVVGAKGSTP